MAPPVVLFTDQWLFVAEAVARVAAEGHGGTDGEVLTIAKTVDWNPWIQAGVGIYCYA